MLGTKASPLVSRMSDERALTVLVPQLVRLRFETVADLARFVQSTFWGTRLQDNIGLFDQLAHIVRYLVEESVLFTLGDLLVATERGAKLSALGLHPQEFSAIERLTTARSVDYEAWVDGLGRACLGTDPDDRDSEALSAVAEFGLSIYNEPGRGHSRARELADRVQRLMEITEAYFSHRLENVPREYQQAWVEAVLDRFTLATWSWHGNCDAPQPVPGEAPRAQPRLADEGRPALPAGAPGYRRGVTLRRRVGLPFRRRC